MNKESFIKELEKLGITITNEQLDLLDKYKDILLEYNKHTNLTAIKDEGQVYLKHFYDSLTIVKAIDLNKSENLLDVGSGAGFPGVVLKIIFPNLKVTLIDSNNKKTTFLSYLIDSLELKNINVVHSRVEDFVKNHRYSFDVVTARAVAHLRVLAELCLPLTSETGYFIALKGDIDNELSESLETLKVLNSEVKNKIIFTLPYEESTRNILVIQRKGLINEIYPRTYDKIIKKPLKIIDK